MAPRTPRRSSSSPNTFLPTPGGPKPLEDILDAIKKEFDEAAEKRGDEGLTSLTRSARPIKRIHQHVGDIFIQSGVPSANVDIERSIETLFGDKKQDVVVIPRGRGKPTGASTLSVGLKGQLRGIQQNRDNHFSAVRAELLNLHEAHDNIVCGHVHVIAVMEWDSKAAKSKKVAYKRLSPGTLAAMIQQYGRVSGRSPGDSDGFAERVALVLVDFSQSRPVVYTETAALERDGFLLPGHGLSLDGLTLDGFANDLLAEHRRRFTGDHRL